MIRNKQSKREFEKARIALEKLVLADLKASLKKQGWKKASNIFFQEQDNIFWEVTIYTYRNKELSEVKLACKPMAIDPILWEVLNMPENNEIPLSFRANGAFVCSSIPLSDFTFEDNGKNSTEISNTLSNWISLAIEESSAKFKGAIFSKQVAENKHQKERGSYAITLVNCLIMEKNFAQAKDYAEKFDSGELPSALKIQNNDGKSFHYHALKWLKNNENTV